MKPTSCLEKHARFTAKRVRSKKDSETPEKIYLPAANKIYNLLKTSLVLSSAGKKVSSAISETVTSTGVPKTVVVLMNESVPNCVSILKGMMIAPSVFEAFSRREINGL